MKKLFLYCFIFVSIVLPQAYANEMVEDYMDIAKNYAVKGDYSSATAYFNRVLGIEPDNQEVKDNIKMLQRFVSPVKKSYAARVNPALDNAMNSKKNGDMTEDDVKQADTDIQKLTDKMIKEIDIAVENKSKDIMTV